MAAPYSDDLRDRVLAAFDRGMKTKQIAEVFQVSPAWARRIKQCRRETGRVRPLPTGGKRVQKIDPVLLAELVRRQPDATLKELRERLGIVCALSSVWSALEKIKLTFKKSRCTPPNRTAPTSRKDVRNGSSGGPASIHAA
jgi:transposase